MTNDAYEQLAHDGAAGIMNIMLASVTERTREIGIRRAIGAKMPTVVRLYSLVLSVGISMGVGIVFGLYPAIRAASLDPIVALRNE
jgi:putative ABC transport system permease protein